MADVTIIQADVEHIEFIAPLFDGYRQFYGQPSDTARARRFVLERITNGESVIFLAFDGAVPIGFTQLYPSFSSVSMKRLWILNDLFVLPSGRKLGIGAALLERAGQFAVETNAKGLVLETASDNPAQKLYERLGWKRDEAFYHYFLNI